MGTEEEGFAVQGIDAGGRGRVAREDQVHTKGRFLSRGFAFNAPIDTTTLHWWRIPFTTDMLAGTLTITAEQEGDTVRFVGNPDTDLKMALQAPSEDLLSADIAIDDKKVTFVAAKLAALVAYALLDEGMWELTFDTDTDQEGPFVVTGYDLATGVVTFSDGIKEWSGTAGDEPADWTGFTKAHTKDVVITMTRVFIDQLELSEGPLQIVIGATSAQSAPMPKGAVLCAQYTVPNTGQTRRVRGYLDILTGKDEASE